jgi:hypothetical protein
MNFTPAPHTPAPHTYTHTHTHTHSHAHTHTHTCFTHTCSTHTHTHTHSHAHTHTHTHTHTQGLKVIGQEAGVPVEDGVASNRLQWRDPSSIKRDGIIRSSLPRQEMYCMSESRYAGIHDRCMEQNRALEDVRLRVFIERAAERARFHTLLQRQHHLAVEQANAEVLELTNLLARSLR